MDGQKFLSSALLPFLLPLMTGCLTERLQVIASSQQLSVLLRSSSSTRRPPSSRRRRTIGLLVTFSLLGGNISGHLVHEQFQDADGLGRRAKGMETTRNDRDPKPPRNSWQPCRWQSPSASGGNYSHRHLLERHDRSGESVNVGSEIEALHI